MSSEDQSGQSHPGYFIPEGHLLVSDGNSIVIAGYVSGDKSKDKGAFWEDLKGTFTLFSGPQPMRLSKTFDKDRFKKIALELANKNTQFLPEAKHRLETNKWWTLTELKALKTQDSQSLLGNLGENKQENSGGNIGNIGGQYYMELENKLTQAENKIKSLEEDNKTLTDTSHKNAAEITRLQKLQESTSMPLWAQGMVQTMKDNFKSLSTTQERIVNIIGKNRMSKSAIEHPLVTASSEMRVTFNIHLTQEIEKQMFDCEYFGPTLKTLVREKVLHVVNVPESSPSSLIRILSKMNIPYGKRYSLVTLESSYSQ